MPARTKTFPCGHRGRGQFCHRCKQVEEQRHKTSEAKSRWEERLASAPVPLDHLPKEVAERALTVIAELDNGKSYLDFKGKRLIQMGQRHVISIPIGQRYRLICKDHEEMLEYVEVLTHEAYNSRLSSGGWN